MNDVRHFLAVSESGSRPICGSKFSGNVVTADVTKVTCNACVAVIEVALERFSVDAWSDKVGMFCLCTVRLGGANFKYMAKLDAIDSVGKLHFTAKDGSQKVFDRENIIEVDARPFNGLPRDQRSLPSFFHEDR